jgi:hypothetical protein
VTRTVVDAASGFVVMLPVVDVSAVVSAPLDAEHELALVLTQLNVAVFPASICAGENDAVTDGVPLAIAVA